MQNQSGASRLRTARKLKLAALISALATLMTGLVAVSDTALGAFDLWDKVPKLVDRILGRTPVEKIEPDPEVEKLAVADVRRVVLNSVQAEIEARRSVDSLELPRYFARGPLQDVQAEIRKLEAAHVFQDAVLESQEFLQIRVESGAVRARVETREQWTRKNLGEDGYCRAYYPSHGITRNLVLSKFQDTWLIAEMSVDYGWPLPRPVSCDERQSSIDDSRADARSNVSARADESQAGGQAARSSHSSDASSGSSSSRRASNAPQRSARTNQTTYGRRASPADRPAAAAEHQPVVTLGISLPTAAGAVPSVPLPSRQYVWPRADEPIKPPP